jgi:tetratricopeptide (TPR) repeat protein
MVDVAFAYILAAKLLTKLGATDVAALAADRAATAAASTDSLVSRGAAAYQVATVLSVTGRVAEAERVAIRIAERLEAQAGPRTPQLISVTGALWLEAAIIAGRTNARTVAFARLAAAERLAEALGNDGNHAWTAFGPANVALHRLAVLRHLGDPGEAIRSAEAIDLRGLPHHLRSRRAQIHLDLADARLRRRQPADALLHLLELERIAPQAIRYNNVSRTLVRALLDRRTRSTANALDALARRAGVLS